MPNTAQTADQIIAPRWLVPVDGRAEALEGHAVAVRQDRIAAVGPADAIRARYGAAGWLNLDRHILLPGLVNTHTHAAMTLLRGYADDLPLMEWLHKHIWPAEAKWVSREFVAAGTRLACAEMLLSGTTTFNEMYFFPDVAAQCAQALGIRICVGLIVLDFPTAWAGNADEYITKGLEVRDAVRHCSMVSCAFAPHAPYTVSDGPLERIATLSAELDARVHIHLQETAREVARSKADYGMRPLARLDRLGLLTPRLIAVHMTQLLDDEIDLAASRGLSIVHCPESNLKLASGCCRVHELRKREVNVALGTDGAASNNDLDMLGEMRTASLLAKGVSANPTALRAFETLETATICGARALGLAAQTGSIEAGKQADLAAVDLLSHAATQPVYHPVSQLVYSAARHQVTDVWVAGKRKVRDGALTELDLAEVLRDARQWRQKIAA